MKPFDTAATHLSNESGKNRDFMTALKICLC